MDIRNPLFRNCISYRSIFDGHQRFYWYPNGMGASVVRHASSYGGKDGLYELAILKYDAGKFNESNCDILPIPGIAEGDGVVGYLTEDAVELLLNKIKDI